MIVTGGSGHLGGWVVHLARGESASDEFGSWDVTATYLTRPVRQPGVDWRQLDVRDQGAVEALIAEVRPWVVVHTAALNPGQGTDFEAVNAGGARHVARAAARVGARLIHVSTDVLFDGEKGNYVEEDPPSPLTPYGRSKALAEEAVGASGTAAIIVRTSLIYGPGAEARRSALRDATWQQWDRQTRWVIGDLKAGKSVHLFTDERRCPIWAESLAAALLELARWDAPRSLPGSVLHVAGAQHLSRYAFGLRLARFHGVDPAGITPTLSRDSGLTRPLDCTLDCSRARALLRTPLLGVDGVLGRGKGGGG
jgi:dTDP-4-dehydrorhamnose reductase